MAILFVGNTLSDFFADASGISMASVTSTNVRDSTMTPNELRVPIFANANSPFTIELGAEYTDLWVHCRVKFNGITYNAASGEWLRIFDASSDEIATIDFNSNDLRVQAVGDTTVTGKTYADWPNAAMTMDVHVELTGGNIVVSLYKDGSLLDTVTAANTGAKGGGQSIQFVNNDLTYSDTNMYYSEFIVTNGESTRGWRLACLEPDGAGFHTDFDGNFTEMGDDDLSTAAATDTALNKVSSTVTYGGPATVGGIRAVIAKATANKGDTGPGTLKQFLRIGATDYEGAAAALSADIGAYMEEWATNPATAAAWATSDLSGIEIGVKAEA